MFSHDYHLSSNKGKKDGICHFKRGVTLWSKIDKDIKISKLERGGPENKHAFWGEKGQKQESKEARAKGKESA